jgi:hypothetical protein
MDKSIEVLEPMIPLSSAEAKELTLESTRHAKVFQTLEEAFAAFDVDDSPSQEPYLIRDTKLPPVPAQ